MWPIAPGMVAGRGALDAYDPSSLAIFGAFTTPPTPARAAIIDTCVRALKIGGVWDTFDLLYSLAAADSQAARINWKNPGTFTASVAAGTPTFSADHGYTGDGSTTELSTGYAAASNAVQLTRNSAHIGVYALALTTTTGITDFGYATTSGLNVRAGSITRGFSRVNAGAPGVQGSGAVSAPLHAIGIRRTSTDILYFRQGTQNTTLATASLAIPASNTGVSILKGNSTFTNQQLAACHLGAALSDAQALACYTALRDYMVAVGAHA